MSNQFHVERSLIIKIMGFESDLDWDKLYDRMAESVVPTEQWLDVDRETHDRSLKAWMLLDVVRDMKNYSSNGNYSQQQYSDLHRELRTAIGWLASKGYLDNNHK